MQNDLLLIQNTSADSTEYEEKFVNLTANKVVFVDINNLPTTTGIGLSSQFLKADGSLDSTTYEPVLPETPTNPDNKYLNGNRLWSKISIGAGGYAGNVYASNIDSDVSGYKTMSYILDNTESIRSVTVNNNTVLSETCLYNTGVGVTVIPAGLWKGTFYAKASSTIGDTTLKIQMFVRHLADGTETDLFEITSPTIENTSNYAVLRFESSQIAFTVLETDRIGTRIKGSTTRTQNTIIDYIVGDGRGLYVTTPLQIRHSQLRDLNGDNNYLHVTSTEKLTWNGKVPYTGATADLDLGLNSLNANTIKLDGTELLIDAFKSGSLGGAGNIFYSTGVSSQPASGSLNQVAGGGLLTDKYVIRWNGSKFANSIITENSGNIGVDFASPTNKFTVAQSSTGSGIGGTSGTGGIRVAFSTGYGMSIDAWDMVGPRWGIVKFSVNTPKVVMEGRYSNDNVYFNSGGFIGVNTGDSAATERLDVNGNIISNVFKSRVLTGTAPLIVQSTTKVDNLNADLLDGQHGSYYQTASPKIKLTPEGGYAVLLTNKTGANSVKGTVAIADPSVDSAFEINPINGDMPIGVVYDNGIVDGSECWVVVAGIAEVLLVNTVASTRSYVAYSSGSVAGRIDTAATVPAATTHFREIGHTMESKTGGTDVLIKCLLHFN